MATATSDLTDVQPLGFFTETLANADPKVAAAIKAELVREQTQIELIDRVGLENYLQSQMEPGED